MRQFVSLLFLVLIACVAPKPFYANTNAVEEFQDHTAEPSSFVAIDAERVEITINAVHDASISLDFAAPECDQMYLSEIGISAYSHSQLINSLHEASISLDLAAPECDQMYLSEIGISAYSHSQLINSFRFYAEKPLCLQLSSIRFHKKRLKRYRCLQPLSYYGSPVMTINYQ